MNVNETSKDEIDIRELLSCVWMRKYLIIIFVAIVSIATVLIVLKMDNIYAPSALLKSKQNDASKMSSMASSLSGLSNLVGVNVGSAGIVTPYYTMCSIIYDGDFIVKFVQKYNFESKVINKYDDFIKEKPLKDDIEYAIRASVRKNLFFVEDAKSGLITISYHNKDRVFAKQFLDSILIELSKRYKSVDLENIQEQIDAYKSEISKTDDISLKNKLADVISTLIQNKVISQAQVYYGFDILTNPSVPHLKEKIKPRRSIICIVSAFSSFLFAVSAVVVYEVNFGRMRRRIS